MGDTQQNLKLAFQGEAEAYFRNHAFAQKAEEDGYPAIAKLFRAVAEAEAVHCINALRLRKIVRSTEENLEAAFQRELMAKNDKYPEFIKQAEAEGNSAAGLIFARTRDVEEMHAGLYKKAMDHMLVDRETEYHICTVCGYIADGQVPDVCPVCQAPAEKFRKVD